MTLSAESECLNKHNGDARVWALRHIPMEIRVLTGDEEMAKEWWLIVRTQRKCEQYNYL